MRTQESTFSTLSVLSMLAVCGLLASTTQAQQPDRPQPSADRTEQAPEAPAHQTTLLTGCLIAGSDPTTFQLTRASALEYASPSQPKAVATSGEQTVYELKAEARLDAVRVPPVEMKALVGRQVEVSVRPVEAIPAAAQKAAGVPTVAPDPTKPEEKKKMEQFTVTAIKQLQATCK